MPYHPHPRAPGYWQYDGLPVQADVETHQHALAIAKRSLRVGASVLDVAAGHGALTKALVDAGFKVSCTSWNDRVEVQVPTYRIDLDKAFGRNEVGGSPFEMICALEIIEHVENPAQFLRSLASLQDSGGLVAISTPNVESAAARCGWFLRGCPYSFSGDEITRNRHISILWREGIEQFISMAGYSIVDKQFFGRTRYHGLVQSLVKRPLHALMRSVLTGDLYGSSRMYVLRRDDVSPRSLGSDDVA
jgi:hypothetical protein